MTLRAQWFLDDLVEDDDPLGEPETPLIEQLGQRFDLRGDPELLRELADLVNQEAQLFNGGVACAIKDDAQTCCNACPVNEAEGGTALGQLCRVGRAQERTLTSLVASRETRGDAAHT